MLQTKTTVDHSQDYALMKAYNWIKEHPTTLVVHQSLFHNPIDDKWTAVICYYE